MVDGQTWSEADGFGGWYDYVCQDGTPQFTGWHRDEDPDTGHVDKRMPQL